MLAPTPASLLCAILLCLPLAIIFTFSTSSSSIAPPTFIIPSKNTSTNLSKQIINPITPPISKNTSLTPQIIKNQTSNNTTNIPPPPPPQPSQQVEDYDDDEDVTLFQLASRVNPDPKPTKKLAFLFLTTSPLPFAPLWELYLPRANNLYNIYVHADPRLNYTLHFKGAFANRVIPSKPTRRHSPTLISAARRLLAHALLHDESNAMFALLSPSCVPIHSFNYTYATLMNSSTKSFVEVLKDEPGAWERWAARGEHAMEPEVGYDDFRIGSQFWVLKRRHARITVNDTRLWSKFKLPCLRDDTCYPDEHYFSTLLNMVDPRGCIPCTLTHVDWKGSREGHPRTYVASEVGPELIERFREDRPRYGGEVINGSDLAVRNRSDPFLFARKFSPGTLDQLMSIANDVLFRD